MCHYCWVCLGVPMNKISATKIMMVNMTNQSNKDVPMSNLV